MKKSLTALLFIGLFTQAFAQNPDSIQGNTAQRLMAQNQKLSIGGYGTVSYNQKLSNEEFNSGKFDVKRMVLMFGYKFNPRTNFITELEMEHVSQVFVEQAFLNYRINDYLNFRTGLMLVPMGITNEYHEPTTFNGVERPSIDKYIVPTTWRQIGAGFTGNIQEAYMKYQVYVFNGLRGHNTSDGSAAFGGKNGLRGGRQKAAQTISSSPNISAKIDFYGIRGCKIGAAIYSGKSQTAMRSGISRSDEAAIQSADSSVIGLNMVGLDARFRRKGLQLKGQVNLINFSNTNQYNAYFGADMGSQALGYLAEVGFNVLRSKPEMGQLIPFIRYEVYNTHNQVDTEMQVNEAYNRSDITMGLGWKITQGSMLKVDYQIIKNNVSGADPVGQLNAGVGVWF